MSVMTVGPQVPVSLGRLRRSLVTLGGADYALLMKAPTDVSAFVGRGFAAIIPAIFGFAAVMISFEYAFGAAPVVAAVAGLIWAGIVLAFDLSLLSHSHPEK